MSQLSISDREIQMHFVLENYHGGYPFEVKQEFYDLVMADYRAESPDNWKIFFDNCVDFNRFQRDRF